MDSGMWHSISIGLQHGIGGNTSVQVVGVNFLMLLKQQGITGSILADEMGLGKTAQAICFLGMFNFTLMCFLGVLAI